MTSHQPNYSVVTRPLVPVPAKLVFTGQGQPMTGDPLQLDPSVWTSPSNPPLEATRNHSAEPLREMTPSGAEYTQAHGVSDAPFLGIPPSTSDAGPSDNAAFVSGMADGGHVSSAFAARQRTAQACERCRERKAKCSGDRPQCQRCSGLDLQCLYSATRSRGGSRTQPLDDEGPKEQSHSIKRRRQNDSESAIAHFELAGLPSSISPAHADARDPDRDPQWRGSVGATHIGTNAEAYLRREPSYRPWDMSHHAVYQIPTRPEAMVNDNRIIGSPVPNDHSDRRLGTTTSTTNTKYSPRHGIAPSPPIDWHTMHSHFACPPPAPATSFERALSALPRPDHTSVPLLEDSGLEPPVDSRSAVLQDGGYQLSPASYLNIGGMYYKGR